MACTFWTAGQHLDFQKRSVPQVLCMFSLPNVLRATTACSFSTFQLPKVVPTWCALDILTSKCAWRHEGARFFKISTSKNHPNPSVFVTFYFQMCFAPQRCALFQYLNFQSGPSMWCFVHVYFKMCFAPQRRAICHFQFAHMSPHPPL